MEKDSHYPCTYVTNTQTHRDKDTEIVILTLWRRLLLFLVWLQVSRFCRNTVLLPTQAIFNSQRRDGFGKLPVDEHAWWNCALAQPNTVIFVLLVHNITCSTMVCYSWYFCRLCATSNDDLVQQLLWHGLWRAQSWLTAQPRWSWFNYRSYLQSSMTITASGNWEAYLPSHCSQHLFLFFSKTGQNKSPSWWWNVAATLQSYLWCGSWTEVLVVLAGLHGEGCTVKTGMLMLSCHCHAVHKVPWRSVTKHSSHLVEHVPAVVRRHSPPAICRRYYSRMR